MYKQQSMSQLWGLLVILITCPLLGAIPLTGWITYAITRQQLGKIGTKNISVSAAFYHGGKLAGILSVFSEAFKGIAAVSIVRIFFPEGSFWELIALMALVIGRYSLGRGAGTTNVVWGLLIHDPLIAGFVTLVAAISFIILRSKQGIKYGVLILFPVLVAISHFNDFAKIVAAFALAGLLGLIYKQIPDDMDLPIEEAEAESQPIIEYLNGNQQTIFTLDDELAPEVFGNKAATLAQVKRWGYSVPKGWILSPFDDPDVLINFLEPSPLSPLVVRSSAIGEDSQQASAAGQYETVLNVTSKKQLQSAIALVKASYDNPGAVEYRYNLGIKDAAMAVLIQPQVQSVYSGVAFSRDPIAQQGDAVIIEAVLGNPSQVVSGKITPEQYRVFVIGEDQLSTAKFEGQGKIPQPIIKQVAYLARRLEKRYHGVPQDVEWSYDGQTLWLLQSRPITTLIPIWTRKIAAEVIPGVIHPLTWSINLPLTCGMWGELFTIVLGEKTRELDFTNMATLHYSRAYFNASFLGEIFLQMGLPSESLDFLTRGAKMTKPPLTSTLENLPGLTKLLQREITLEQEFKRDYRQKFIPGLTKLSNEIIEELSSPQLLSRIDMILDLLNQGTYYSILSPLSAAIRQAISGIKEEQIDHGITPEVASLRSLKLLAAEVQESILGEILPELGPERVLKELEKITEGKRILNELAEILEDYGYLSEVATDISVPRWKEQPHLIKQIFVQFIQEHQNIGDESKQRHQGFVQRRIDLKGRVTEIYSRLLAELRWTFLALEKIWIADGLLQQAGDIFFLKLGEVRRLTAHADPVLRNQLSQLLQKRRSQYLQNSQITQIPPIVYGNNPPHPITTPIDTSDHILLGIPASQGQASGQVKIVRNLQEVGEINKQTILVVPYTDSGWATILVRAGGVIAEAGGKLSHGAIVAREYGIPAVMDVRGATYLLRDGQQVKIDGSKGIVELESFLN